MQPIPPEVGQLKFFITRNKSMWNSLQPSFHLNLEKSKGGKVLLLYAKKLVKKTSYYLISLEKNKDKFASKDGNEICLGKLRAIDKENDRFILYDNGENYEKSGT